MLIRSPRHRTEDLVLWAEYEAGDRLNGLRFLRSPKLERSESAVADFVVGGDCYGSVSWGKDSVVLAFLLWAVARHVPLVHLRPSNHNPGCDDVRDAFFAEFPGQSYAEIAIDYRDIPLHPDEVRDKETDKRWFAGFAEARRRFGARHLSGVRADESAVRAIRCKMWGESTKNTCAPLAWWTASEVMAFIAVKNLPMHPDYAMLGGGRWKRDKLRVAEIGDTHGRQFGRMDWEREYYGDVLRRMEANRT